ncbi:MAG: DUF1329 domain-containing protein, partial [Thermodesulfobacteriota bacterium]|nr:DUF1329 domain-containing protein [Thermodesulfobacteriota bacterium]
VDDVIKGKVKLPTIEDLTSGKVKEGDLIAKDNVDLVKEYLPLTIYKSVMDGMVMSMGKQLPPDQLYPKTFADATEKNKGKAVMDENGTVWYEKVGVNWPGGLPFPEPKSGLEIMANVKFGWVPDTLRNYPNFIRFVDKKGRAYKQVGNDQRFLKLSTRTNLPPLGSYPGYENMMFKRISVITSPLKIKGLGQYSIRFYDDTRNYDTGFAYLPAFKRTIRVSGTTWQDNMAGSDCTYGDGMGFLEPYSDWTFKFLEKKYILLPEPKSPFPYLDKQTGKLDERLEYDVGKKFVRFGFSVWPVTVVEAKPKIKHIYGKRVLSVIAWPYWHSNTAIGIGEMYDRQMKPWKYYCSIRGNHNIVRGEHYTSGWGTFIYDTQTQHMTQLWADEMVDVPECTYTPEDLTLKALLEVGR